VSFTSETTDVLDGALERIAKASEPAEQLGVRCTGVGLTGYLRGQTKAPRTLQASLLAINQRLVREPAVRRWLKQRQLLIAAKRKKVRGVTGDVWRLRLAPRPEARDRHRDPIDTLMHVRKASYFITTGRQPSETLRMLVLAAAQEDHAKLGEELKHVAPERTWFFAHADFDQWLACVDGTAATADRQRVTVALGANRKALELNLLADAALLRRWIAYLM
jgi:hypothetical protein